VGGGPVGRLVGGTALLPGSIDDVVRQFGIRVYELMMYDPAVSCAVALWKAGVMSDGLQLSPGLKYDPGEVRSKRAKKADYKLAEEICDAAKRSLDCLEDPVDQTIDEFLDCFVYGSSLGEQTFREAEEGPDKGKWVHNSLVPKPRWAWSFLVDRFNKVVAIRGWNGEGWVDLDRDRFAVMSWKPKHRDPRGRSGLRAAYTPWNEKLQKYPDFGEFLHKFAEPSIAVTASPDAQPLLEMDDDGTTIIQKSVLDVLEEALEAYRGRSYLALPPGATAQVLEGHTDGAAYHGAFDRWDMEIFRSILFGSRPVQEAQYGSKADSDSGLGLISMAFQQGRAAPSRAIQRDVLRPFVRANWGRDVAARMTPVAGFGSPTSIHGDLLKAYAAAYQTGFLDEAQLPVIWDRLGLPPIDAASLEDRLNRKNQAGPLLPGQANGAQGKGPPGNPANTTKPVKPADKKMG
jgi:hypothetical protein